MVRKSITTASVILTSLSSTFCRVKAHTLCKTFPSICWQPRKMTKKSKEKTDFAFALEKALNHPTIHRLILQIAEVHHPERNQSPTNPLVILNRTFLPTVPQENSQRQFKSKTFTSNPRKH
eukprot:10692_5